MKQFIQRLLQARQLIGQDVLAGLRLSIGQALLITGLTAITMTALALANANFRSIAERAVAGTFPGLTLVGTAQAAEIDMARRDLNAPPGRDLELPTALLVGLPAVQYEALSREQQAAALFLARKYGLAPDAIAGLVSEAYHTGKEFQLDPLLLLAVMSIESRMNPFAQSPVGAQGLMQIMADVHAERFEAFGGPNAALNPVANIRVGAQILRDLHQRFGTTPRALKAYVGATDHPHDAGYGLRVLTERARIESAITGQPFTPPIIPQTVMASPKIFPAGLPATRDPNVSGSPSVPIETGNHLPDTKKDG